MTYKRLFPESEDWRPVYYERIIEAGAYRNKNDMKNAMMRDPLILGEMIQLVPTIIPVAPGIVFRSKAPLIRLCDLLAEPILAKHSQERTLPLDKVTDLVSRKNGLDSWLEQNFDILSSSVDDKSVSCGFYNNEVVFVQEKKYSLMLREGLANVSTLSIELQAWYQNNDFNKFYALASIEGKLAEEQSNLARGIIDYWTKNDLFIMNNLIIIPDAKSSAESEVRIDLDDYDFSQCFLKYVRGSIKALAVEAFIEKFIDEGVRLIESNTEAICKAMKKRLSSEEFEGIKKDFISKGYKALPFAIIDED